MKTKLLSDIADAASILKEGGIVAIPTETVYGLAARAFDPGAIAKIYLAKGRPSDNPLIAHISSLKMGETLISDWPAQAQKLADRFWPGPLTLVLPKKPEVPLLASGGLETIGIRMPNHPDALSIISRVGEPLVAPSANLSGRPSPTQVKDVLEDLEGKIDAVFEGGCCEIGIESTILSLAGPTPQLLRPGAISQEEIEEALGMQIIVSMNEPRALAPGMKYRHYAPKARIELVREASQANGSHILSRPTRKTLYQSFREADRKGATLISIVIDSVVEQDKGLMNRIQKAAMGI